jgi:hypothetical protein
MSEKNTGLQAAPRGFAVLGYFYAVAFFTKSDFQQLANRALVVHH